MALTGAARGADRRFYRSFSTIPKEHGDRHPEDGYSNGDPRDSGAGRPWIPGHVSGTEQKEGEPEHCRDTLGEEVGVPLLESIQFLLSISDISVDLVFFEHC